ncbi:ribokinase [Sinorhizobium fredii]|uniref:Ribokinase RbsK n=1 Tax=Sinorhizobium fredii (strain USDA 257) TaxID=1185652 RepID=I3X3K1_SINF2|nr:ribokinase [Sinorhizobium fredii]AFL50457.1 ribokinase RbsK [Sinorhizobium fredii USDA 257]
MTTASPSVVVFGSLHYDIMVHGPARPRKGETVTGDRWHPKCGGKGGNQAVSAAKTGIRTSMIGAVADDEFGRALAENLCRNSVDHRFVKIVDGVGSGMSVAIFDSEGDYGAVIVSGSNLTLGQSDVSGAAELFTGNGVLVLQNEVLEHANVSAARAMKSAGGRVILNAAPARPLSAELAKLVDIIVVNAIEAEQFADVAVVDTLRGALNAAKLLAEKFPVAVVTAGGDGVACATNQGEEFSIEPIKVELVSTHGAGDEFTGVLAAELAKGAVIEEALQAANLAAAKLVSLGG